MKNKIIMVVVAHPDDEILGCGGTISRLARDGHEVYTLILGEGITSRDQKRDFGKRANEISKLKKQAVKANKAIGVKKVFHYDFADNRFDSVPLLDIIKVIEKIKGEIKPDIIFTHYRNDLNIDHRVVYQAVITATRPVFLETVKEIYSFNVLSSTEWNYPLSFSPNVFFDISRTLKDKIRSLRIYKSELKASLHPRSVRGTKLSAEFWGVTTGLRYSEAFECVRAIK